MKTDIYLVEMPFSQYAMPVYSLSLLKGCLNRAGIKSRVIYGNMRFSKQVGLELYLRLFSHVSMNMALGDAVFAEAAFGKYGATEKYRKILSEKNNLRAGYRRYIMEILISLQAETEKFIETLGDEILAGNPKIVAFSSVFFQNNAALALAKYIKEKNPAVITMIGGANSMGESAWGMVKYNSCIDYAFSGDADECFGDFCAMLLSGKKPDLTELPYGVLRADMKIDGNNIPIRRTENMDALPYPDYSDWFAELDRFDLGQFISPGLLMEFSRGCWWHEKKPCSFCGLNYGNQHYRTKSADRIVAELRYFKQQWGDRVQKIMLTDNILSQYHIKELLPKLIEEPCGFALMSEVKSNMTREDIRLFRQAGFTMLQPGIESLQDDVLVLMNKGNRAIKHVELLKNFAVEGIKVVWNFLAGFPGERPEYYEEIAELIPWIAHLKAPLHFAPILFARGSAYYLNPEQYGLTLSPGSFYAAVYPNEGFRNTAAIFYDAVNICIEEPLKMAYQRACEIVNSWCERYYGFFPDSLVAVNKGDFIEVLDMRQAAAGLYHNLRGAEKDVAVLCEQVKKREAITDELQDKYSAAEIMAAIENLKNLKLLLEIRGELLFLPIPDNRKKPVSAELSEPGYYYERPKFPKWALEDDE